LRNLLELRSTGSRTGATQRHESTPRGVYENYLDELKELMSRGAGEASR
jgi:hypothetical protein